MCHFWAIVGKDIYEQDLATGQPAWFAFAD
jgi:hypothetical protein